MNWAALTRTISLRSKSGKFLIVFSLLILAAAGIIWACADSGPYEDSEYSAFAPEYFIKQKYSPFFYTPFEAYHGLDHGPTANERFNEINTTEWYNYFNKQIDRKSLKYLLIDASEHGVDSVSNAVSGGKKLPPGFQVSNMAILSQKQFKGFINYLKLAKTCEDYSVYKGELDFDSVKRQYAPMQLEGRLLTAFKNESDPFIKERLWFQLVRYYYFSENSNANHFTVKCFDQYKDQFPKNLTWYRAYGYVAGYYYSRKKYALANYIYSRCYDYSFDLEIPSYWSFHPQNESDWNETLGLAKSKEEKVTLWTLLGTNYDLDRSMRAIAAIDPKSEKLDFLLSYMINSKEYNSSVYGDRRDSIKNRPDTGRVIVDSIAKLNNTGKPYYWNLAAGYMNYLDSNYTEAEKFYSAAKKQLPANNKQIFAQAKLLDILLYIKRLRKIDPQNEQQLVEPLNWLADLQQQKVKIKDLRYTMAVADCAAELAKLYRKQGEYAKAMYFAYKNFTWDDINHIYGDSAKVASSINLLNKPNKTPFEHAMLRFYSTYSVDNLYYHQAIMLAYNERLKEAIAFLKKRITKDEDLLGNPFDGRMVDCHDCDHAAKQKQKFTPLSFLVTLQKMKDEIKAGKNVYRNAYLVANANYNMSYYGNARTFFENDAFSATYNNVTVDTVASKFLSMRVAAKYYAMARANTTDAEQQARCTYMLSKCALNEVYNHADSTYNNYYYGYFDELKTRYSKTNYYKEVLQECGFYKEYLAGKRDFFMEIKNY